jgi:serine/threonine protein kinase
MALSPEQDAVGNRRGWPRASRGMAIRRSPEVPRSVCVEGALAYLPFRQLDRRLFRGLDEVLPQYGRNRSWASSPKEGSPAMAQLPKDRWPKISEYELVEQIGEGGSALVFLAKDRVVGRNHALKVFWPMFQGDKDYERFQGEIRALSTLDHPQVAEYRSCGLSQDDQPRAYLVTDYVEGVSIKKMVHERTADPAEAVRIASEALEVVAYCHARGIVHRDLSPGNLILRSIDQKPVVIDFGLAFNSERLGERLTATGSQLGTPGYMSQEVVVDQKHVDVRNDVYSVGAVLYSLLQGKPPHLGNLVSSGDATLDAIIEKALAPEARRYSSANELRETLENWRTFRRRREGGDGAPRRVLSFRSRLKEQQDRHEAARAEAVEKYNRARELWREPALQILRLMAAAFDEVVQSLPGANLVQGREFGTVPIEQFVEGARGQRGQVDDLFAIGLPQRGKLAVGRGAVTNPLAPADELFQLTTSQARMFANRAPMPLVPRHIILPTFVVYNDWNGQAPNPRMLGAVGIATTEANPLEAERARVCVQFGPTLHDVFPLKVYDDATEIEDDLWTMIEEALGLRR